METDLHFTQIFEEIIHSGLNTFIADCNIISSDQYGFLKNKGTKDALASISDNIYSNLNLNNPIDVAFLYLAKASDTVDYKILLGKLCKYGIRRVEYDLIKNYLANWYQVMKTIKVKSNKREGKIGVSQRTVS